MKKPEMRDCLQLIKPYEPGKPVEEVERELGLQNVIKMASNENPLGPSPLAVRAMRDSIDQMHIYPDGNNYYLKEKLAGKLGVDPGQLVFGNGSDELLAMLSLAYISPGEEAVMPEPSFSEYEFAVRLQGGIPKVVPLRGENFLYNLETMLEAVAEKTKLIFICNPNNPTGSAVDGKQMEQFVGRLPDGVVLVLDQAYIEYSDDPEEISGFRYIREGLPVISLRTFSKIYGLAGLRIGYGIAPAEIVADLNRVRQPFNVNAMAQKAAIAALDDDEQVVRSRRLVTEARIQIKEGLREMGLKPVPDQANFCFIDVKADSRRVFQALLGKGVIVRTGDIFGQPTFIRVTYGTKEQNERFMAALKEVLTELA